MDVVNTPTVPGITQTKKYTGAIITITSISFQLLLPSPIFLNNLFQFTVLLIGLVYIVKRSSFRNILDNTFSLETHTY